MWSVERRLERIKRSAGCTSLVTVDPFLATRLRCKTSEKRNEVWKPFRAPNLARFLGSFCNGLFFDGGPGGIRTLDLSDANRTLSRTRHNASTEHLEGNGCVLFKTGTGCVLFDIFHRTARTSAPILNKQELSINPSLRQPSEKYSANRRINFPPIIGKLLEYLTIRCILKKKRNRGSRNEGLQKTSC